MRLVCLSDTHNLHLEMKQSVPDGDVLIHAGDLTNTGDLADVLSYVAWAKSLPHPHKIIIAGNHDYCFDPNGRLQKYTPDAAKALCDAGWSYLEDSSVEIEGTKFYGSPWQPWFFGWAFNIRRGPALAEIWEKIPEDTDVLITHGPPMGILDQTAHGDAAGCEDLLARVEEINPLLHIFGHIHEAYGSKRQGATLFVNPCICTLRYQPTNMPIVVDLVNGSAVIE